MSRLDINARVYAENRPGVAGMAAPCMWFARCTNEANGLRRGPIAGSGGGFGDIPICQRCDDKIERLSA